MGLKTAAELGLRLNVGDQVIIRPDIREYLQRPDVKLFGGIATEMYDYQGKIATVSKHVDSRFYGSQEQDLYILELVPDIERTIYWSSILLVPVFTKKTKMTLKLK